MIKIGGGHEAVPLIFDKNIVIVASPPKTLTDEERNAVCTRYAQTGSLRTTAGEFGISPMRVKRLWEGLDETGRERFREAVARLLGADPGPGAPAGQAKHIFSHVEWQMTGWRFTLTRRLPAPEGCVWATAADLADTRPLPGAFKAWRRVMETEKMPAGPL